MLLRNLVAVMTKLLFHSFSFQAFCQMAKPLVNSQTSSLQKQHSAFK